MARAPNEKTELAKSMYQSGVKLVEIAKKLDVPQGTIRRWKSTYNWDAPSKKEENERSDSKSERSDRDSERSEYNSERSDKPSKLKKGGQLGNTNALKNATYASIYWKDISEEERAMTEDMPLDEEFHLIEELRLTALRERRYMAFLSRYRELLNNSPDGLILKEDLKSVIKEANAAGVCLKQTATAQQTKIDAVEQMQIIEAELTRIQKIKIKIIDTLSRVRKDKNLDKDSENNELTTVNIYIPDNGR